MKPAIPEIVYGFFCETIRTETSGQITPIGIWGDAFRIEGKLPVVLPTLAFHAFVRDPDQVVRAADVRIRVPGLDKPILVPIALERGGKGHPHNLNVIIGNFRITSPGKVIAELELATTPIVSKKFSLEIQVSKPTPKKKSGSSSSEKKRVAKS